MARRISNPISDFADKVCSIDDQQLGARLEASQPTKEMTDLANAFNSMMQTLQASFQRQQQFTSNAAHELRTPVSIILSQSEFSLLRDRTADENRQGFETCRRTAIHMKQLVDQLLEVSRLDSGQLEIEFIPVRVDVLAEETIRLMEPIASDRNVQIRLNTSPLRILGEPTKVQQIILNLLANAVEHSPTGSMIQVEVDRHNDQGRLRVIDQGSGIAPAHLPFVWNRFYRADQARTHNERSGSGLGLSLVAELVKLHGGSYEIESTIGVGTIVSIFFQEIRDPT